ncbi:hypothetical protein ABER68_18600 [Paenibacillus alvei]
MKQPIFIFPEQREMLIRAMSYNRSTLQGMNKKLFDIAFNKVNQKNNSVELDGMEMILVSQSLHKYGKFLSNSNQIIESKQYRIFGEIFEKIRKDFQKRNGSKVKKSITA